DVADVFWADGGEFRVIADERLVDPTGQRHRAAEGHPSYSPDGRRMVFSAARELVPGDGPTGDGYVLDGRRTLMVGQTRPGATGLVAVSPLVYDRDALASDEEPAWSPDGNHVAFVRRGDEAGRLAILDLGTGDVQLVDGIPGQDANPTWSPDGR